MPISHIGQASLLSRTTKTLRLLDVLRVPSVTRSLLSVPKLTRDNNVFVEFHPFHFFVKDRDTRDVLLSGRARVDYMRLMCHESMHEFLKFSVVFGCHRRSGTLALATPLLPLCAMCFIAIIFLLTRVIRSF